MNNEEFKFYRSDDICDTRIFFEDWQDNSPASWTDTTQFNTLEECCANRFWYDYERCVDRSPMMFKFDFCFDIHGLVHPQDCQSADTFANVMEDAINDVMDRHQFLYSHPTVGDANITKIGDVSLTAVGGLTHCGGSLSGQGFTSGLRGSLQDVEDAEPETFTVCGVITVKDEHCKTESCLNDNYLDIVDELNEFVDNGDLTLTLNQRSKSRIPTVPELFEVVALPFSLTTQNLLLPETVTDDAELKYYRGSDLRTCMQKSDLVFQNHEQPYDTLHSCCIENFGWDVKTCCSKGGGCPEIDVVPMREATRILFYPTWIENRLCDSKEKEDFYIGEPSFVTLEDCCDEYFPEDGNCLNPTA